MQASLRDHLDGSGHAEAMTHEIVRQDAGFGGWPLSAMPTSMAIWKTSRNTSRTVLTAALRLRRLCERLVKNLTQRSRPSAYEMLPPSRGLNRRYCGTVECQFGSPNR